MPDHVPFVWRKKSLQFLIVGPRVGASGVMASFVITLRAPKECVELKNWGET
jgi:hypothetical protein